MCADNEDYCGCCGRIVDVQVSSLNDPWCSQCTKHVLQNGAAPWDRTYLAQHGVDCPYQVGAKRGCGPTLGT